MQLTRSDLGRVKPPRYISPRYHGKSSDIDWAKASETLNGKPAKEIAAELKISLVAVYKAADRGDIEINYQKGKKSK